MKLIIRIATKSLKHKKMNEGINSFACEPGCQWGLRNVYFEIERFAGTQAMSFRASLKIHLVF